MREVGDRIKALDAELKDGRRGGSKALLLQVPNLPHPIGAAWASATTTTSRCVAGATPRTFAFTPKPHVEVGEALGLLDIDRARPIAKSRFAVLWGALARLERALAQLMLDLHTREHGYTEVWVPHLVNARDHARDGTAPEVRGADCSRRWRPTRAARSI